jgi:hypothetical protein
MIRVVVEVRSGSARYDVVVLAENIQRAVSLVAAHHRAGVVRVRFPIDPEGFFVKLPGGSVVDEQQEMTAA